MTQGQTMWDGVVVGAGLAGLAAAQQLQQAGKQVLVLEKSRGLGGRLATRRVDQQPLDHGCRYLQPTTNRLQQLIEPWVTSGLLLPWQPQAYSLGAHNTLVPSTTAPLPYYVAPTGMTAPAKQLGENLTIWRQHQVTGLTPISPHRWSVQVATAPIKAPATSSPTVIEARQVILAIPAPQILPLLLPLADSHGEFRAMIDTLKAVSYAPVITVMAGYGPDTPCHPIANQSPDPTSTQGWMVQGGATHPFIWIGLDSSKRPQPQVSAVVIHSSPAFAQPYLARPDYGAAGADLLQQTAAYLGDWLMQPVWHQVHRWRYGLVNQPLTAPYLGFAHPAPLICCGDWCGGNDAGAALESGIAAALALL